MCIQYLNVGVEGKKSDYLQKILASPLFDVILYLEKSSKRFFERNSFLAVCTPKAEGRGPKSCNWPFSRHLKDIYRLRYTEASPMTLNGHTMETDEPVFRCLIWSAGPKIGQK